MFIDFHRKLNEDRVTNIKLADPLLQLSNHNNNSQQESCSTYFSLL